MIAVGRIAGLSAVLVAGTATWAEERPGHFEGEPSRTLEQAVTNFSAYNRKLEAVLAKDQLTPADLATIHELTYTLENALAKIHSEFGQLADTLEAVHVASERADSATVRTKGREYLSVSKQIVDQATPE